MKSWYTEVFVQNPFLGELKRLARRHLRFGSRTTPTAAMVLAGGGLVFVLMLVAIVYPWLFNYWFLGYVQLVAISFVVPALTNRAIAGERERRTWDLLMVAPISLSQVVWGKFFVAVIATVVGMALMLLPMLIGEAARGLSLGPYYSFISREPTEQALLNILSAEMIALGYAIPLAALGIFISARCQRAFTALVTTQAIHFLAIAFWPIFVGTLGGQGWAMLYLHPYVALSLAFGRWTPSVEHRTLDWSGIWHLIIGLVIAIILVLAAEKSVRDIDNYRGFGVDTHA